MAQEQGLTLGDLLSEPEFRMTPLVPIKTGILVEGIHLSELDDPTYWMSPRSILLTVGVNIAVDAQFGVRLIDRLADTGMAGLGIALEHYLEEVPAEMVKRAEQLGFPLFTIPFEVPFRRISAYVYGTLASKDTYRLRRTLSLQTTLLDLLLDEQGPRELVERLGRLLDTTVLLYDGEGTPLAHHRGRARLGKKTREEMWEALRSHQAREQPQPVFQLSGYRVSYRGVWLSGRLERALAAVFANQPVDDLAETTLSFAQKLLTLDRLRERDSLALRRRMRSALFDDLLSQSGSPRELGERLSQYGLARSRPLRLALLDLDAFFGRATRQGQAEEEEVERLKTLFLESVEAFLAHQGLPYLTLAKSDAVLALIQFRSADWAEAERTLTALQARAQAGLGVEVGVAVSASFDLPERTAAAFREAGEALRFGRKRGLRQVLFFDLIHPPGRLLVTQPQRELRSIVKQTLGAILEHDARHGTHLTETLETFLAKDMSRSRTAGALALHRNTLGKRLERVETLSGFSLSRTDDVVALTLGLRSWEMLGQPKATELEDRP